MHADLVAAIKAGWPRVHFVTVVLPDYTIRWADSGSVAWGGDVYAAHDATYGALDSISEIVDGLDDDASPVTVTIIPPDLASVADITAADAQGGRVTIDLGAVNPATRVLVSEPYRLFIGELDQPRLKQGRKRLLEYDIITGEARGLEPNEEQRQTDGFRQYVWPDERGDEYATEGTKLVYWREDEPRLALGFVPGRGVTWVMKGSTDKAIQMTYEPNAPLAFPMGRVGVGATVRYRVGYGPTNRYNTAFCTVAASGPVQGLVSVAFDDVVTTFDGFDRAVDGDHAGEMWFKFLPGAQPSPALTSPVGTNAEGSPAPGWTTDHKLSGRACFAWTGKENSKKDEFRGGLPRMILTLNGLRGWDARLDGTQVAVGGSGASRLDIPTTWTGITEGGVAALNWAIGRWEGSNGATPTPTYGVPYESKLVGGIGAPIETIDVPAFVAVSDIADGYGWTMAGVPFSDEDKNDVLEDLLAASGARRSRRAGLISCVSLAAPKISVLTATESDTVGAAEISLGPSRLGRVNTGIPGNLSEDHRWEITTGKPVSNSDWVVEDGGRRSEGFTYRFADQATQAAQLCYLELAAARERLSSETVFKPYLLQVEAGECFDWDAPQFLLEGVKALVLRRSYDPQSGLVKIRWRQETDEKYTEVLDITGELPPPSEAVTPPERVKSALVPMTRTLADESATVLYPTTADDTSIDVVEHKAIFDKAEAVTLPAATISGLTASTLYGVFWHADAGYAAEPSPALTKFQSNDWVFVGWQATEDGGGIFPVVPPAPGGWGGFDTQAVVEP